MQVQDFVLIVTDGASQDEVELEAKRLRDTGAMVRVKLLNYLGRDYFTGNSYLFLYLTQTHIHVLANPTHIHVQSKSI